MTKGKKPSSQGARNRTVLRLDRQEYRTNNYQNECLSNVRTTNTTTTNKQQQRQRHQQLHEQHASASATIHIRAPDGSRKVYARRLVVADPRVRVVGLHPPRGGVVWHKGIHPPQDDVPADLVIEAEVVHSNREGGAPV